MDLLQRYQRAWLRDDVVAGFVLTALLIPAGMGYAQAAGLPPQSGLYATVVPLVVYAVVGPSSILVLGPDSSLAPIIAAAVLPLAGGSSSRAVALAGLLAVMMGVILVIGGLLRVGFITDLLSKPIRIGYLNGVAVVVIIGQVPQLLGISAEATTIIDQVDDIGRQIAAGAVAGVAPAIGIVCLVVLVAARVTIRRLPAAAIVVVGSVALTAMLDWHDDVAVVGALPDGLPAPSLGGLRWDDVSSLLGPAVGIALIAFADTGVLSRTFAARRGDAVDGSHEMGAVGATNLASGLLGGFPVSASATRTTVADQAGAHSQLTGVVGAALVVLFVLVAPGLTGSLPSATLAAVVIVAASGLVDVAGMAWLLRVNPVEGGLCIAAFVGVVFVGVLEGIAIAVALSVVAFVQQAWRPYRAELGRVPGLRGYHDLSRHTDARRLPGIVIVRFDAPLFFANAGVFGHFVRSVVGRSVDVGTVIVAAEPITDIDTTALEELVQLDDYLRTRQITLVFAELKGPVKDQIQRYGVGDRFDAERFMPTVGAAVDRVTGDFRSDLRPPDTA